MVKAIKYFAVFGILSILFFSCDYLDKKEETDGMAFEDVFGDSTRYGLYVEWMIHNPLLQYLQNGVHPHGTWDDISDNSVSTTGFNTPFSRAASGDFLGMRSDGRCVMVNNATWERIWKHVRIANMGLNNIDMYPGSEEGRRKILGTCYFYRAFAYMELCRRWGGMPYFYAIFDDLSGDLDAERLDMRTTYLNAAEDFKQAAIYLEPTVELTEWQHPTSVAALALRSRVMMYAASDQATKEGGTVRSNLWKEAAMAADTALRVAEANGHSLVEMGKYYNIFKGTSYQDYIKEVIFGRRAQIAWGSDAYLNTIRPPGQLSGKYGPAANQNLVDCFEMQATGLPIDDMLSGYHDQNPYAGRDPRFYHNILYNGAKPYAGRVTMELFNRAEDGSTPRDLSYNGGTLAAGYTPTGTYAIKWMGDAWNAALPQVWPYIRLAELYLNFAESANEAWTTPTVAQAGCRYSAVEALNVVRDRATMPDLDPKFFSTSEFRNRVRNERRVELCFEDHRLYDIRRWMVATQPENRDIYRVEIVKLASGYDAVTYPTGFRYEPKELFLRRVFEDRHYLFAIKAEDTYMGVKFKQNPGWGEQY